VYNLPFDNGQKFGANVSRLMDEVLGGWQTNAIVTLDGGTPFDINTSGVNSAGIDNRADALTFQHVAKGFVGGTTIANRLTYFSGTFAPPPTISVNGNLVYTRAGNVDRNQFFGPGYTAVDFGIFKRFRHRGAGKVPASRTGVQPLQ
jgi:hypothetical protein